MRHIDWENRLNDYINANRDRKFRYGRFDCVTFTMGAVKAITGVDHTEGLDWSNRKEADAILDERPLDERLADKFEEVPRMFAQRGDIGMHDGACGVVVGRFALFIGDQWRAIPLTELEKAYRV